VAHFSTVNQLKSGTDPTLRGRIKPELLILAVKRKI
jgi:hypothetical protein